MSVRWCRLMSTSNPKCRRKSAPTIGFWTSATINIHCKLRRRPRLRVIERVPYVEIGVSLTAIRVSLFGVCL